MERKAFEKWIKELIQKEVLSCIEAFMSQEYWNIDDILIRYDLEEETIYKWIEAGLLFPESTIDEYGKTCLLFIPEQVRSAYYLMYGKLN